MEDSWENFEEKEKEKEEKKKAEEKKKKEAEEKKKAEAEAKKKKGKRTKDALAERDRLDREREQQQMERLARMGGVIDKAAQQRMVEEADFRNAQDMFGDLAVAKSSELDGFIPKSAADFARLAEMLSERAADFAHDVHYQDFATDLCKKVVAPLKSEDLRRLIASLNTVLNAKIKQEKGGVVSLASRKKKQAAEQRAKALALKQMDEEPDEEAEDEYARYEDKYDFM